MNAKLHHRVLLVPVLALLVCAPLVGWDNLGHMTVAYLAYQQLEPETKARVDQLIALNPDIETWRTMVPAGTPVAKQKMMLFMIAATWPDQIKSKPGYKNDSCDPASPISSQNKGYTDKNQHRCWHFKDIFFSADGTALPAEATPNAETQIEAFRAVLASDKPDRLKSYDLVWLLHLVGDAHQPLHATSRVSASDPGGDRGGNSVKTRGCASNLHACWDDLLGTGNSPATAVRLGNALAPADSTLSGELTTATWIKESFDQAKESVYVDPVGEDDGPVAITAEYKQNAKDVASKRVALAGARLAKILNQELK